MLEKEDYYVSLKSKEISIRSNLTEAQYEISASKSEMQRLQMYLRNCKEFEVEETRLMLNPFTFTEDKVAQKQYNEDVNTVLNLIYDLGTKDTRSSIAEV